MRFKVGDKVEITRNRFRWFGHNPTGTIGVVREVRSDWKTQHWYGPIEIVESNGSSHYCKEEDVKHINGPETPYDKKLYLPRDRWMKRRVSYHNIRIIK